MWKFQHYNINNIEKIPYIIWKKPIILKNKYNYMQTT